MYLVAIAATSLDGFITQGDKLGTDFTSDADKQWFGEILNAFPIRIMGSRTFNVSREHILSSARKDGGDLRIVLTRSPKSYRHLEKSGRLVFTAETPHQILNRIRSSNHESQRIAILGGGDIYCEFLQAGLINEFWITVEPMLFGSGTPLLSAKADTNLKLIQTTKLSSSTLLLKYKCKN